MHTVSFIIYITVWLTLLCVLFDFYWIHIKICGESVPSRPDRTEKIWKSPEGLTKSVRFSGLFFLSPESVFKRVTQNNNANLERAWAYDKRKTDKLCEMRTRTAEVNQFWFTIWVQNRKSESNLIHSNISPRRAPCVADAPHRTWTRWTPQTRRLARLWGCGAAWAVQLNTRE